MKVNTILFIVVLILSISFADSKKLKTNTKCTCPSGFQFNEGKCQYMRPSFPWKWGDALNNSGMFRRCEAAYGAGNCEQFGAVVHPKCVPNSVTTGSRCVAECL